MAGKITIRPLEQRDFPNWLPLWNANNLGHIDHDLTTETWSRLLDPNWQMHGIGVFEKDQLRGMLHYIIHPTTGSIAPVCYMQDVFIDPFHRRKGFAKKLIAELTKTGRKEKWARIYWLAENNNESAQKLYQYIGTKLDFSLHAMLVD